MINAKDKRLGCISYILEMEKSRYNLKKKMQYTYIKGLFGHLKKKLTYSVFELDVNSVR